MTKSIDRIHDPVYFQFPSISLAFLRKKSNLHEKKKETFFWSRMFRRSQLPSEISLSVNVIKFIDKGKTGLDIFFFFYAPSIFLAPCQIFLQLRSFFHPLGRSIFRQISGISRMSSFSLVCLFFFFCY